MIRGYQELEKFTGLLEHYLRRAIAYYGFPKPHRVRLRQKSSGKLSLNNLWQDDEVLRWMAINKQEGWFYVEQRDQADRRSEALAASDERADQSGTSATGGH